MADLIDSATDFAMNFTQDSELATRALVPEEKPDINEDGECECGETIPYKRLRLGYSICTSCSEYESKRGKQYSRKHSNYDDE